MRPAPTSSFTPTSGEGTLEVGVRPQQEKRSRSSCATAALAFSLDPIKHRRWFSSPSRASRTGSRYAGSVMPAGSRYGWRSGSIRYPMLSYPRSRPRSQLPPRSSPKSAGAVFSAVPSPVVSPIVSRLIGALATQADLTLDRLSDAQLVGEAISAHVHDYISERICIAIEEADHRLDICIGPLAEQLGSAATRPRPARRGPLVGAADRRGSRWNTSSRRTELTRRSSTSGCTSSSRDRRPRMESTSGGRSSTGRS